VLDFAHGYPKEILEEVQESRRKRAAEESAEGQGLQEIGEQIFSATTGAQKVCSKQIRSSNQTVEQETGQQQDAEIGYQPAGEETASASRIDVLA
jgi:hypothetical protein